MRGDPTTHVYDFFFFRQRGKLPANTVLFKQIFSVQVYRDQRRIPLNLRNLCCVKRRTYTERSTIQKERSTIQTERLEGVLVNHPPETAPADVNVTGQGEEPWLFYGRPKNYTHLLAV